MKQLPHIGTIETISLPSNDLFNVPAKIDTGADSSAIWASDIRLVKGKLKFFLFSPESKFYKSQPIVTTIFRTTTVRNSFGHKEFRYKVCLSITIGDQQLNSWFTLADRSRNTYPILLGKNILKHNFIVDVSQKNLLSKINKTSKVLVLTGTPTTTQEFLDKSAKLSALPVTYDCVSHKKLRFLINGVSTRVINTVNNQDLTNYNFVYFKNQYKREFSAAAAEYLQYKARPFANQEFLQTGSASKLTEYMRLSTSGLQVPTTICAYTPVLQPLYKEVVELLGTPFVLKEIQSDKGLHNYVINAAKDFNEILSAAPTSHVYCAQRYIANDGFYRMYVMGRDVYLAVWRSATPNKNRLKAHLNKPTGGANAVTVPLIEVPGAVQDLAVRAASVMNRQICGVDLVQDKDSGSWYILEANADPQLSGGSFIKEKAEMVAKYIERELNQ